MVQQASAAFIDSFDSEVKIAYQGRASLKDTVRMKDGVVGETHRFPKAGKGVATQHNRGNDVVAMNAGRGYVEATLYPWDAFDYVDILDATSLNWDDKEIVAKNTAKAIGRREDQIIIDACIAAVGTATTVGDGTADITVALLAQAKYVLDNNNVDGEDRHVVHSAKFLQDLLNTTQVTSSDYNTVKALVKGDVDTYLGFKFHLIGSRTEGGLPYSNAPTNTKRYNLAYHKEAVGLAISKNMQAMVDWVAVKTAWQVGCVYKAGGVAIDTEGIVIIHTKED